MKSLDCHAHIALDIASSELARLNACVVAVTRSPKEYSLVQRRNDLSTVWALGAHPGIREPHEAFDIAKFCKLLEDAPIVGEIGLDGHSRVQMDRQQQTFESILTVLKDSPRVASVHSVAATELVIGSLETHKPTGIVLHWWRGTKQQTGRALKLGCCFSVNAAEVDNPKLLDILPRERVLTETDHPFGNRHQHGLRRPGEVTYVENALAAHWEISVAAVRRQIWGNFRRLAMQTGTVELFPEAFQKAMLAA